MRGREGPGRGTQGPRRGSPGWKTRFRATSFSTPEKGERLAGLAHLDYGDGGTVGHPLLKWDSTSQGPRPGARSECDWDDAPRVLD